MQLVTSFVLLSILLTILPEINLGAAQPSLPTNYFSECGNNMVELGITEALPELSEEKHKKVEKFLKDEMTVKNDEDLERITEEDLIRNDLLTLDQAVHLVNYWKSKVKLPNNWDMFSVDGGALAGRISEENDGQLT